jgi:hypothetical protein
MYLCVKKEKIHIDFKAYYVAMSQSKTCRKCGGIMKLKDEIKEGDSVSEVTPLDRTYTCDCGHMEVDA